MATTPLKVHKRKRSLSWGSTTAEKQLLVEEWRSIKDFVAISEEQHYQQQQQHRKETEKKRRIETDEGYSTTKGPSTFPTNQRIGDYLLLEPLGSGSGGTIWRGRNIITGQVAALKIIDLRSGKREKGGNKVNYLKRARREASIMAALNGQRRIVKLHGVIDEDDRFAIVMQLAEGGDLLDYILREKRKRIAVGESGEGGLEREEAWRIFGQIVEGLIYAHSRGFVHRDVKPENIFLDRNLNVLLGDWGYGCGWSPYSPKSKSCGSLNYVAPELLMRETYIGPEVDIFALGAVLFGMITGCLPFGTGNRLEKMRRVLTGDWGRNNKHLTPAEVRLLDRMFERNVLKRATMYDVVEYLRERHQSPTTSSSP